MKSYPMSTKIDIISSNGKRTGGTVGISVPIIEDVNESGSPWMCEINISVLKIKRPVFGNDSLQCICLAIYYVKQILLSFKARGGKIVFPGTNEPINIDESSFVPYLPLNIKQIQSQRGKM